MERTLPMFPLGSVLVPTAVLPLHVFEPRYRALVRDVLAGDREFGVVLIERGSEVGGGDHRSDLGTIARIVDSRELDDGRWAVVGAGTRRIRVVEWLEDAPYPRAVVDELEDGTPSPDASDDLAEAVRVLRRVLAIAAELGIAAPPATTELADDPVVASYNALALAPIGPLDRHRLLGLDDPGERLRALTATLREVESDLRAQMALGDGSPERDPGDDGP